MKENKKKASNLDYYAPFKTYLWGLVRIRDGWKDLGEVGFVIRDHKAFVRSCADCHTRLNIGKEKVTGKVFHFCPRCDQMYITR